MVDLIVLWWIGFHFQKSVTTRPKDKTLPAEWIISQKRPSAFTSLYGAWSHNQLALKKVYLVRFCRFFFLIYELLIIILFQLVNFWFYTSFKVHFIDIFLKNLNFLVIKKFNNSCIFLTINKISK